MVDTIWDLLRGLNIAVALWCSCRLVGIRLTKWSNRTDQEKVYWNGFVGANVTVVIGSLVNLYQNNSGGPQVLLALLTMIFIVWGTYMDDSIDINLSHRWKV